MSKNIKHIARKILNEIHSMDEWKGGSMKIGCADTYEEYDKYLGKKEQRPIATNTILVRTGSDEISVRLHWTDILTIDKFDTITINSGRWMTKTTKSRLDGLLCNPLRIYSEKGNWFIKARNGIFPFKDGMKISSNHDVISW